MASQEAGGIGREMATCQSIQRESPSIAAASRSGNDGNAAQVVKRGGGPFHEERAG